MAASPLDQTAHYGSPRRSDTNSAIGRMTVDGAIARFPLPKPDSRPFDITVGPDGNLWFTETRGNRIGRITPAGAITEFRLPAPPRTPFSIVAGPDGALWFTEDAAIGRLSMTGAYTEFPVSPTERYPDNITTGPDGALWFTEQGTNQVSRITTSGAITGFYILNLQTAELLGSSPGQTAICGSPSTKPTRSDASRRREISSRFRFRQGYAFPIGITAGPDGALWFTEHNGNAIGRLDPARVK